MRKTFAVLATGGLLLLPAGALASDGHHHHAHPVRNAAQEQCRAERAALGVVAFRQKYGPKHAFRKCVAAHRPADMTAAKACRAERRALGKAAFRAKYGAKHALRNCIVAHGGPANTP